MKISYPDKGETDQLDVYLETIDSYGYKLVYSFFGWPEDDEVFWGKIYDESGKLVYEW